MKLYHGSSKKLYGNKLIPKQARSAKNREGNQIGVYSTNRKDFAIVMALLHQKGVGISRVNFPKDKAIGTIYIGWPKQAYFYLYTLSSKNFTLIQNSKGEWISKKEIKPLKVTKLKTEDYIHLIRKGTKNEYEKHKELVKRFKLKMEKKL